MGPRTNWPRSSFGKVLFVYFEPTKKTVLGSGGHNMFAFFFWGGVGGGFLVV